MNRILCLFTIALILGDASAREFLQLRLGSGKAGSAFETSGIQYQRWNTVELSGASMLRVGIMITELYRNGWSSAPDFSQSDALMQRSWQFGGMEPVIMLNWDSTTDNPATVPMDTVWMGKDKWYNAGMALANRYRPNSAWWLSQGITDFGATDYCAKNEPGHDWTNPSVETPARFALEVEAFADGVHAVDWSLRTMTGGFWGNYTDYYNAIVPLVNDGTLYAVHSHPYASDEYPWIHIDSYKPQNDYDSWLARGVADGTPFVMDEAGYNSHAIDGTIPSHRNAPKQLSWLTGCYGVVDRLGLPVTEWMMPWCIAHTDAEDPTWGCWDGSAYNPIGFNTKGKIVQMITSQLQGMQVIASDPKGEGITKLSGNGTTVWIFHNRTGWTNSVRSMLTLFDIPQGATQLKVAYWDSWNQAAGTDGSLSPAKTINISGHGGDWAIPGMRLQETALIIADAETPLGAFDMEKGINSPGRCEVSDGHYQVMGGGTDIWNDKDGFNFVFTEAKGDCVITAKVNSLTNSNSWAKAGVMIREGTGEDAKYAAAMLRPDRQAFMQWRGTTGSSTSNSTLTGGTATWKWLRVRRSGNSLTSWYSADGSTWVQIGNTITVTMGTRVLMGLAVTSHNTSVSAIADFSNVVPADLFRLKNRWKNDEWLLDSGVSLDYGSGNNDLYRWYKMKTSYPGYWAIINWQTNDMMHIQHNLDRVECTDYMSGREDWDNSRWYMPEAGPDVHFIISGYTGDGLVHKIHVEDQTYPKHTGVSGWSAHWEMVD